MTLAVPTNDVSALTTPELPPLDVTGILEGKRLVVLGGTGFLGKVWLSMLLDRFPNIGHVYLMVRPKSGHDAESRFWSEIVPARPFDPLRKRYPGDKLTQFLRDKVTPLPGDVSEHHLGFPDASLETMRGTIHALVNASGLVDFNPPIDEAIQANAFGIRNIVELAKSLGNVPIFHTSTTYVAGGRNGQIPEQDPREFPFPKANELDRSLWSAEREIAECVDLVEMARHRCNDAYRKTQFLDEATQNLLKRGEPTRGVVLEDELKRVQRKFIRNQLSGFGLERAQFWGWANTYTYTKSIGEQVLLDSGLPVTIGRPSVIESSIEYPFPGWNEGINTSAPWIFLAMKGHVQYPCKGGGLDVIPVDMVAAAMIASLAALIQKTAEKVYQYCAGDVNPVSMERWVELFGLAKRRRYRAGTGNPLVDMIQKNFEPVAVSKETYRRQGAGAISKVAKGLAGFFRMGAVGPAKGALTAAAKATDAYAELANTSANLMEVFIPFTHDFVYEFRADNTRSLFARMPAEDRAKLPWYPESVDWRHWFLEIHAPALEKWVEPLILDKFKRPLKTPKPFDNLWELLDELAERHQLAPALQRLEPEGLVRVSYQELRERALAVSGELARLGVLPGDRVILSGKNHPSWAMAYFGILRAGATVVPVDPELDPKAFLNIARSAKARIMLIDDGVLQRCAPEIEQAKELFFPFELRSFVECGEAEDAPDLQVKSSDIASLIFTSGTTGTPKGVMLSHANFASLVAALVPLFPLKERDSAMSVLPLHHTFEFTCGLLLPLSCGARITYLDELNGERLVTGLKEARVTAMVGVPALWQLLERRIMSQVQEKGPFAEMAFNFASALNRTMGQKAGLDAGRMLFGTVHKGLGGHLRYLVSGGASLPEDTHKFFQGLGLHMAEGYGLTEASPVLTVAKASPKQRSGHVGTALPGVEIKIESPDERGVGEVLARGNNVMVGYADNPEATEQVKTSDGWLRTGDLGTVDRKGRLTIVGRSKDVIVTSNGENIYPDEIEAFLGRVEHVEEFSILGIPDGKGGELVACLAVPSIDSTVDRGQRLTLADEHMQQALRKLPRNVRPQSLHWYDAPLPRTATRKVKRNECRDIIERISIVKSIPPAPESIRGEANDIRRILALISGKKIQEIQGNTRLASDLGMDSLAAVELVSALDSMAKEAGRPPVDGEKIVQCETVAELEGLLRASGMKRSSPTAEIHGTIPSIETFALPEPVQEFTKAWMGELQRDFYGKIMRTRVTGRAFIPHNRNSIVVANHTSHLDLGVIKYALGSYGAKLVTLAAKDYFFENWRRHYFENFTNVVSVDRHGGLRESLQRAGSVIAEGRTLLLFPEGTRSTSGMMTEFRPGVGYLALEHGVDILPVHVAGAYESWPKGQKIPTKRDLTVRIGPPLSVETMRRKTQGMRKAEAARVIAYATQLAVSALREGKYFDFESFEPATLQERPKVHPIESLFQSLVQRFKSSDPEKGITYYFSLGEEAHSKWTVKIHGSECQVKRGKPEGGQADCVLKTNEAMMEKIIRDGYVPDPSEFVSGTIKTNNVEMLFTFVQSFALGSKENLDNMARYLVTGATGFLGRHSVQALLAANHEVVALCRKSTPDLETMGVKVVLGDVLDVASVERAAEGCSGVFHLAGKVSRRREDAAELFRVHVMGTENVLSAAYRAGVRKSVVLSTSGTVAISADPSHIATEKDETPLGLIQRWPYYRAKLFAEQKAFEMAEKFGDLSVVCLNPTLLLGPGDLYQSSTEDVQRFLEGKVPAVPPGGLSYVDVRDVANVLLVAMEKGVSKQRYLLGACNLTLGEFFDRLARVSNLPAPLIRLPRIKGMDKIASALAERAQSMADIESLPDPISLEMAHFYWYLNASKAESELGFTPRDPIDTLADTVDDLLTRGCVEPKAEPLSAKLSGKGWALFDGLLSKVSRFKQGS
jgi:long-chain acyl-CoA synthetase